MTRQHDRPSTSALVYEPKPALGTWYLIVSGDASSRVVPLAENAELVLGRDDDVEVPIDHHSVSRRHARVRRRGDQITVEDLGSRNGTHVNGAATSGVRRVTAGDVIGVGPVQAIVATSTPARHARQVGTATELEDRLAAEVDRAVRYHRPLGLVMLRFDGPVELMTDHVEQVLHSLRRMDLLAEYGADELALVLPESDREACAAVARRASSVPVGLDAGTGVATFPEDGSHVGELIGVARDRLRGIATAPVASPVVADPLMKQVMGLARQIAAAAVPVLIVGETGVGKEVVAETIHRLGPRRAEPFVRQSCAAVSEALIEAELRAGLAAAAHGTLFLDEIGELPLAAQGKLLRALDEGLDVRVICASHRDLPGEVNRGRFRADLYARLGGFSIPVPPLRDRSSEIEPLAHDFAAKAGAVLGDKALEVLRAYAWPGNVRELKNAIERAAMLAQGGRIEPHHLPDRLLEKYEGAGPQIDVRRRVAEVERDAVIDALEATNGNQTRAAKKLGISRFALIRLMDKHDLR